LVNPVRESGIAAALPLSSSPSACQESTQVSPQGVVVCGAPSLCEGNTCRERVVEYGSIGSYLAWCDCDQPEDIFDTGVCHAVAWKIGEFPPSRACRGECAIDPSNCEEESGTHTYKRCICQ